MREETEVLRQELASYRRMLAVTGDRTIGRALRELVTETEARLRKIQEEGSPAAG